MTVSQRALVLALMAGCAATVVGAEENKITPTLTHVEVLHQGQPFVIRRAHGEATIPEIFQKTGRGCPPFCIQPMRIAPGVETVGELDVLAALRRIAEGAEDILVIDSRTPDWVLRGTIPGSINIPWNTLNSDREGEANTVTETFPEILVQQFGAERDERTHVWHFERAKTLVLFCNGIWCGQSSVNIKTLLNSGYPADKIKWYRGGMQDWVSAGLTIVKP